MGVYVRGRHDCGLTNTDGKITGLMLTRKNNVPQYAVFYDQYLANQFFTGEPGYSNLPAEKELAMRQSSWRSGFGLDSYDSADAERYLSAKNMDMRFKGMAIAGSTASAIDTSGLASGAITCHATFNGKEYMNKGASLYKLDGSGDGLTLVSTRGAIITALQVFGNFLFIALGNAMGAGDTLLLSSDAEVTTTSLTPVKLNELTSGHNGTFRIKFDIKTSSQGNVGGRVYRNGTAVGTLQETASTSYVTKSEDIAGWSEGDLIQLYVTSIGTSTTSVRNFRVYGVSAYPYEYMDTSESITASTATVTNFKYFELVDAATPVLWGSDGANTIRSNTNPVNDGAAWSGVTTIASFWDDITGLFSDSGLLYVTKEDMPYYLDSSGNVQNDLAPELATLVRSVDNGKNANWWLAKFYMPWGRSLLEEDGGTLTWRNPNDMTTNLSDFAGQVFAVAGDDRYLYAVVDNGAKVEVGAGRMAVVGGTTQWVWHFAIAEITLTGCENCWVSSVYQKRLWISSTATGDNLYYIPLPLAYGDILADANRDFVSGGEVEMPWMHGNFKDTTKAFPELTVTMLHNYDADIYFSTHYKTLSNSTYTKIADMKGSATSMVQTNSLPDAGSDHPVDTLLRLKFVVNTDDSTKTPVLGSYKLRGFLNAPQRRIIALQVRCAQDLLLNDGSKDISFNSVKATMDELVKATWPVAFTDIAGTVTNVRPLPASREWWQTSAYEKGREQERIYNLLLQEV